MIRDQFDPAETVAERQAARTAKRSTPPLPVSMTQTAAQPYQAPVTASNYFSDPLMQGYVDMSRTAIGRLNQPTQVPQMHPALTSAIGALQQLLSAGDPGFDYFRPIAEQRMSELDQPGYTTNQLDAIRTQSTDPMTAQRDAMRQNVIQRFAAQGIPPTSGIVQQALLDLDRTYAQETTKTDTQVALHAADQDEARRQERVNVGAQAAGLAGRNLPVRASAAGALAGIGENQQQMAMQADSMDTNKLLQAVGISQNLGQLPVQLQAQALASLNALQGPVPQYTDPSMSMLLQLMGLGEQSKNASNANTAGMWQSIIGVVPGLLDALGVGKDGGLGK